MQPTIALAETMIPEITSTSSQLALSSSTTAYASTAEYVHESGASIRVEIQYTEKKGAKTNALTLTVTASSILFVHTTVVTKRVRANCGIGDFVFLLLGGIDNGTTPTRAASQGPVSMLSTSRSVHKPLKIGDNNYIIEINERAVLMVAITKFGSMMGWPNTAVVHDKATGHA